MNGYGSPLSVAVSRPVPVSPDLKAELTITLQSSLQVPHRHHRRNVLEHNRGRHTSVVLFRLAIVDAMGIVSTPPALPSTTVVAGGHAHRGFYRFGHP